jgi:hypothetical protein
VANILSAQKFRAYRAVVGAMPAAELVDVVPLRFKFGAPDDVEKFVLSAMPGVRLSTGEIILVEPRPPERRVTVTIQDSNNAVSNIATGYTFFEEGLKRVHPAAYAPFFTAAIASGAASMTINSGWRPMLGSIAHRAGLGIDVSILGPTVLNRDGLTVGNVASLNVSAAEKALFHL